MKTGEIPQPFLKHGEGGGGGGSAASVSKKRSHNGIDTRTFRHIWNSTTIPSSEINVITQAAQEQNGSQMNGHALDNPFVEQDLESNQVLQNESANMEQRKKPDLSQMFNPQKPELRLSMLDREHVADIDLVGEAADYWFGPYWRIVAYHSNPNSDFFQARESEKDSLFFQKLEDKKLPENIVLERFDQYRKKRDGISDRLLKKARKRINSHLGKRIKENYKPTGSSTAEYFTRMADSANDSHRKVMETLFPEFPGIVSQLNEVELQLGSPAKIIEYISRDDVNLDLKHELQKQLVRTYIAAEIESRDRLEKTRERVQHIHELFDTEVFAGKLGDTSQLWVTSFHSNRTKSCTYINNISGPARRRVPGSHKMSTPLRVRQLQDFDFPAYVSSRVKNLASSGVKAIRKPIRDRLDENGDAILDPRKDVPDTMGVKIALLAGKEDADTFRDYLDMLFLSSSSQSMLALRDEFGEPIFENPDIEEDGSPILDEDGDPVTWDTITDVKGAEYKVRRKKYKGRVMKIVDDSETDDSNRNSNGVDFHRLQVYFSDTDTYAEVQIQTLNAFLDSEYEIGELKHQRIQTNTSDGSGNEIIKPTYTGKSHETIYEPQRVRDVRPKFIKNSPLIDLDREENSSFRRKVNRARQQRLGRVT